MLRLAFVVLLIAFASTAALPAIARADGDPASDYLLEQQVFLGSDSTHHLASAGRGLQETVRAANEKGFPIRVAVIASTYDLGAVTQLWGRPQTYARFLGIELSLAYKGRLLVVMPDGFGFYWHKHPTAGAYGALNAISIAPGGAGQLEAASEAVRRLAAKAGVSATPTTPQAAAAGGTAASSASASSRSNVASLIVAIAAAVLLALVIAATIAFGLRRRPRSAASSPSVASAAAAVPARPADPAGGGPSPGRRLARLRRRRLVLLGTATFVLAGAAVAIFVLSSGTPHTKAVGQIDAANSEPQVRPLWKPRQRLAPSFHLRDQNGRPISLSQYRGKPVIVTFIDPTCRHLCPLEAHVLNELDRRLPPAARPTILAVSVNVYSDSHADLMRDFKRWSLVPQWHWAVGRPSALKAVWKRYYATVEVTTKRIAGVTVHYIRHSEMAYIVDSEGYERSLFEWPFKASEVEGALRALSNPSVSSGEAKPTSGHVRQSAASGRDEQSSGAGNAAAPQTVLPSNATPKPTGPSVLTTKATLELGTVLAAGPKKLTVYEFSGDRGGQSMCYGECAALWQPVLTKGPPQARGGARSSELGTTKRVNGELQVTYEGHPLYHYLTDGAPSDAVGEGLDDFGGRWYVLTPSGRPVKAG